MIPTTSSSSDERSSGPMSGRRSASPATDRRRSTTSWGSVGSATARPTRSRASSSSISSSPRRTGSKSFSGSAIRRRSPTCPSSWSPRRRRTATAKPPIATASRPIGSSPSRSTRWSGSPTRSAPKPKITARTRRLARRPRTRVGSLVLGGFDRAAIGRAPSGRVLDPAVLEQHHHAAVVALEIDDRRIVRKQLRPGFAGAPIVHGAQRRIAVHGGTHHRVVHPFRLGDRNQERAAHGAAHAGGAVLGELHRLVEDQQVLLAKLLLAVVAGLQPQRHPGDP